MTKSFFGVVLLTAVVALNAGTAPRQIWTSKLPGAAKWYELTALGSLLVGTDGALLSIDPENGSVTWQRTDITKSNRNNAREIPGTPVLICNNYSGMMGSKITMQAINFITGETLWATPQVLGMYLTTIPVPEKNLVIFMLQTNEGDDNGIYLRAHDLQTGEQKWSTKFCKSGGIPLHMADNTGRFIPTMDLSGYHDPIVEGDLMYLGYLGVSCLDLVTGAIKWEVPFPSGNKALKRTYAPLRIDGEAIYGAGGGSVYAINRLTGELIWKSDRISEYAGLFKARDNAIVAQLEVVGGKVFSRYGGNFSDGKTAQLREPIGVVVLNAANGEPLYQDKKIDGGITNLMVLPETGSVMFADGKELVGVSTEGETLAETFRVPIEFKRKMGGGDVAKIGLGLTGGLMGAAKALKSQSKARLDVPVAIIRQDGYIVVQGKQHLLGFDPVAKDQKWSLYYAAPSDALATVAMFAVTLASSAQGNLQVASSGGYNSQYSQGVGNIHRGLDSYNAYTEKRALRAGGSKSSESYTYILTKLGKGGDIGLYGVNLKSGETDREIALGSKEPEYLVDEEADRIFFFKSKDSIVTYQF